MSETYTQNKDDMTVTVWMITLNLWAYIATRGTLMTKGSVNAYNRIDAWDLACVEAEKELWTPEMILEREG